LINQLEDEGFRISPEAGRELIEDQLAKGLKIEEIRQDQAQLTLQIYERMLERETTLCPTDTIFLDRGLPDAFVFFRYAGMDPNLALADCFQRRYAGVFLLDRLPYQKDGVRVADDATAEYFDSWQTRDYESIGYEVERVPVMAPDDRLDFVLRSLSRKRLI
jgi:predicted ATPase